MIDAHLNITSTLWRTVIARITKRPNIKNMGAYRINEGSTLEQQRKRCWSVPKSRHHHGKSTYQTRPSSSTCARALECCAVIETVSSSASPTILACRPPVMLCKVHFYVFVAVNAAASVFTDAGRGRGGTVETILRWTPLADVEQRAPVHLPQPQHQLHRQQQHDDYTGYANYDATLGNRDAVVDERLIINFLKTLKRINVATLLVCPSTLPPSWSKSAPQSSPQRPPLQPAAGKRCQRESGGAATTDKSGVAVVDDDGGGDEYGDGDGDGGVDVGGVGGDVVVVDDGRVVSAPPQVSSQLPLGGPTVAEGTATARSSAAALINVAKHLMASSILIKTSDIDSFRGDSGTDDDNDDTDDNAMMSVQRQRQRRAAAGDNDNGNTDTTTTTTVPSINLKVFNDGGDEGAERTNSGNNSSGSRHGGGYWLNNEHTAAVIRRHRRSGMPNTRTMHDMLRSGTFKQAIVLDLKCRRSKSILQQVRETRREKKNKKKEEKHSVEKA